MSNMLTALIDNYWEKDRKRALEPNANIVAVPDENKAELIDKDIESHSVANTNNRVLAMYGELGQNYADIPKDIAATTVEVGSMIYNNVSIALNETITRVINTPVDLVSKVGDAVAAGVGRVTAAVPGLLTMSESLLLSSLMSNNIVKGIMEFPATLETITSNLTEETTWLLYSTFKSNVVKVPISPGVSKPSKLDEPVLTTKTITNYPHDPGVPTPVIIKSNNEEYNATSDEDDLPYYMDASKLVYEPGITPSTTASSNNSVNYPTMSAPFNGRDSLADLELSSDFYWDIIISIPEDNVSSIPALPFPSWFPIYGYTLTDVETTTKPITTMNGDVNILDNIKLPQSITLDIVESLYNKVDHWRREYIACIFRLDAKGNIRVLPYKKQMINITIYWMTPSLNVIRSRSFACIPDFGALTYTGNDTKAAKKYSMKFIIQGTDNFDPIPVRLSTGVKEGYHLF